jgi:hypothetical protein
MNKLFRIIFSLLFLVSFIWLIIAFIRSSFEVQAGILSFIGTVCIATYNHVQTKKREIEARHFNQKRETYMHYINLLFGLIQEQKKGKIAKTNLSQQQMVQMMNFKKELLVWGSPEVIQAYYQFENFCDPESEGEDSIKSLLASNKLFKALRKDLGHDDSILGPIDLIGLILKPESKRELEEVLSNESGI